MYFSGLSSRPWRLSDTRGGPCCRLHRVRASTLAAPGAPPSRTLSVPRAINHQSSGGQSWAAEATVIPTSCVYNRTLSQGACGHFCLKIKSPVLITSGLRFVVPRVSSIKIFYRKHSHIFLRSPLSSTLGQRLNTNMKPTAEHSVLRGEQSYLHTTREHFLQIAKNIRLWD